MFGVNLYMYLIAYNAFFTDHPQGCLNGTGKCQWHENPGANLVALKDMGTYLNCNIEKVCLQVTMSN